MSSLHVVSGFDHQGLKVFGVEVAARRAAQIEANRRRVNEAIEAGTDQDLLVFICECGQMGCGTTIAMRREEYEMARTDFDRFLVAPDHEIPAIEEVLERHDRYLLVRKRDPDAREVAEDTDPRTDG